MSYRLLKIASSAKKFFPKDFFNLYSCRSASKDSLIGKSLKSSSPVNCLYPRKAVFSPPPGKYLVSQIPGKAIKEQNPAKVAQPTETLNGNLWLNRNQKNLALLHQLPKIAIKIKNPCYLQGNIVKKPIECAEEEDFEDESLVGESKFIVCKEENPLHKNTSIEVIKKLLEKKGNNLLRKEGGKSDVVIKLSGILEKYKNSSKPKQCINLIKKEKTKNETLIIHKRHFSQNNEDIKNIIPQAPSNQCQVIHCKKTGRHLVAKKEKNEQVAEENQINDITFGDEKKIEI